MIETVATRDHRRHLSVVIIARIDNHGCDLLRRVRSWIDGIVVRSTVGCAVKAS